MCRHAIAICRWVKKWPALSDMDNGDRSSDRLTLWNKTTTACGVGWATNDLSTETAQTGALQLDSRCSVIRQYPPLQSCGDRYCSASHAISNQSVIYCLAVHRMHWGGSVRPRYVAFSNMRQTTSPYNSPKIHNNAIFVYRIAIIKLIKSFGWAMFPICPSVCHIRTFN